MPERCRTEIPVLADVGEDHSVGCWYPLEPGDDLAAAAEAMTPDTVEEATPATPGDAGEYRSV